MTPDRWRQVEDLYHRALELEESQRAAFLQKVCNGDEALRYEVDRLLAEGKQAESFLEEPAYLGTVRDLAANSSPSWIGRRVHNYEVVSLLGVGGMGEVYRARDTKLKRDVAIKVLPDHLLHDQDRVSRFHREAEILAALNHPGIAAIYGVEETNGVHCLVLEIVEGDTLQDRLQRGPIPVEESLQIAKRIAEALEAAHQKGIIHRDLKPANIKITPPGKVKVLDFGLAKVFEDSQIEEAPLSSPTVISRTMGGALVGTIAYMSPEQARGQKADRSADIWAFGGVLYEMITGKQAFSGETFADIAGAIVKVDPDWNVLPANTPPAVRTLLRRCLEKDRDRRIHDIADARIEIEDALTARTESLVAPVQHRNRERLAWTALVLAAAIFSIIGYRNWLTKDTRQIRFQISLPPDTVRDFQPGSPSPGISTDGRYVAFIAVSKGQNRLYLRALDSLNVAAIAETDNIEGYPFWSPDSRFIGFFSGGKLKTVPISGGPPQPVCDATLGWSGTWSRDDVILFESNQGLQRVSARGGVPTTVLSPDKEKQEFSYRWPSFLPDGKHFLFLALNPIAGRTEIRVASLDGGPAKPLLSLISRAVYAPPGFLLFVREGTLMAQPFDAAGQSFTGEMFSVAEGLPFAMIRGSLSVPDGSQPFAVSNNGTLVYGFRRETHLLWFNREGKQLEEETMDGFNYEQSLSPDENRLAYVHVDAGGANIWIRDLRRKSNTRLTNVPGQDSYPVWSPQGDKIAFSSNRSGKWELYQKAVNSTGDDEPLGQEGQAPYQWSDAGILFLKLSPSGTNEEWLLPPGAHTPLHVVSGAQAQLSSNGQFIAYSNPGGIYVQPFPTTGRFQKVSVNGGYSPYWRFDGKELFFTNTAATTILAVDFFGNTFGVPHELFQLPGVRAGNRIALTRDGQRFLFALYKDESAASAITAIVNWTAGLKK